MWGQHTPRAESLWIPGSLHGFVCDVSGPRDEVKLERETGPRCGMFSPGHLIRTHDSEPQVDFSILTSVHTPGSH